MTLHFLASTTLLFKDFWLSYSNINSEYKDFSTFLFGVGCNFSRSVAGLHILLRVLSNNFDVWWKLWYIGGRDARNKICIFGLSDRKVFDKWIFKNFDTSRPEKYCGVRCYRSPTLSLVVFMTSRCSSSMCVAQQSKLKGFLLVFRIDDTKATFISVHYQ